MIIGISFVFAPTSAWAGDHAPPAGQGGQQVHLAAVSVPGAADGLAVHPDRDQRRIVITAAPAKARSPAAAARSISHAPVTASKAAASAPVTTRQIVAFDGGPARAGRPRTAGTALPAPRGHVGGPPGDRGERPGPGDHRRGGQRQHRRHRMIPPLTRPPVRHPREQFQQVTAIRQRRAARTASRPRARSPASPDISRPSGAGQPPAMTQSSTAKLRLARVRRKTPRITGASPYFMIRSTEPIPDRDTTSRPAARERPALAPERS